MEQVKGHIRTKWNHGKADHVMDGNTGVYGTGAAKKSFKEGQMKMCVAAGERTGTYGKFEQAEGARIVLSGDSGGGEDELSEDELWQ